MLDLDAIRERCEKATPGEWREHYDYFMREADAEFCAHARTDLPACLAEIERLRGLVERAKPYVQALKLASTYINVTNPSKEQIDIEKVDQWLTDLRGGEDVPTS